MFLVIVKSTSYFYLLAYSVLSVFSLLICIEDIDHQSIVCPRVSPSH